ncbi:MAG TPA: molybdenum cofactor biosynthesis protein MoaE [Bryobacteraceae bacterium]|nr:molybdenum cofactor biosynthesis protein MoaE [Bryobacteraceae bacterium]
MTRVASDSIGNRPWIQAVCYDAGVRVRVLFFGQLKDIVGCSEELLEIPEGSTVGTVFGGYRERFPRVDALAASVVPARNQQFAALCTPLADNDEVAFLPPVSGGAGYVQQANDPVGHFYALTRSAIDTADLRRRVLRGQDGAAVTFEGVVRDNTKGRPVRHLMYECYEPMAIRVMQQIGQDIAGAYAVDRIGMVHRLGPMEIGEASVVIMVSAPHRGPAFEAALEGINRVKRLVPIWKKEFFADGEVWVEGEWDDSVVQRQP